MKKSKIFFLHVPKTGGQTLAARLTSAFPIFKSNILGSGLNSRDGARELALLLEENDFVERHVTGSVLRDFSNLDVLVTIREPISHIVSTYLHIRREPKNVLYQAANLLSPKEFFLRFGKFFLNIQSNYLVSSYFDLDIDPDQLRVLTIKMFDALDRNRWVVPTESIDEFTVLWSLENRRYVTNGNISINIAEKDECYKDLIDLVGAMQWLYSVDLLLWRIAQEKFSRYRKMVLTEQIRFDYSDDSSRAYWENGSGIWLRDGWYLPQVGSDSSVQWWAGPTNYSEVVYKRNCGERYLSFSVAVVCGLSYSQIYAVGPDMRSPLAILSTVKEASLWHYHIDLVNMPDEGRFYIWVPEVWAPIMVNSDERELRLQSFSSLDWRLTHDTIVSGDNNG